MVHHNTNNATVQHDEKVTGVHTVESWLVQDENKDKSNLYGYNLPKGTWFVTSRNSVNTRLPLSPLKKSMLTAFEIKPAVNFPMVNSIRGFPPDVGALKAIMPRIQ